VRATPNLSDFSSKQDAITLGNDAADSVSLDNSQGDTVTLGDGAFDSVDIAGFFPSSGNTIILGDGEGDSVKVGYARREYHCRRRWC